MANNQQIDINVRMDTGKVDLCIKEVSYGISRTGDGSVSWL